MDLKELLGDDLYSQVTEKLGDKKIMVDDGNLIPKSKFEQVNEDKKAYKGQVEKLQTDLEAVRKKAGEVEGLNTVITELKETLKKKDKEIADREFNYSLDSALKDAKCKNTKALKALLDMDSIKYQDGKLDGLENQLNSLKESDSYLFDIEIPGNTGGIGNFGRKGNSIVNPWSKETFNLTEQARILKENPALAEQLKNNK
ncbi:phage scaffolding protein [Romboutsia hominis]|uniref:Phage minor structural protein GP20 n=1 Tax=Romboutsia hominis TaxID=1507512 RepID=A0A2P2BRF4_9FIRM|nr:phage scaffolding protein [Romboutsia hominis]CEI72936.1 Phage minor structural protein GP20 [Romboutsia hominis]